MNGRGDTWRRQLSHLCIFPLCIIIESSHIQTIRTNGCTGHIDIFTSLASAATSILVQLHCSRYKDRGQNSRFSVYQVISNILLVCVQLPSLKHFQGSWCPRLLSRLLLSAYLFSAFFVALHLITVRWSWRSLSQHPSPREGVAYKWDVIIRLSKLFILCTWSFTWKTPGKMSSPPLAVLLLLLLLWTF